MIEKSINSIKKHSLKIICILFAYIFFGDAALEKVTRIILDLLSWWHELRHTSSVDGAPVYQAEHIYYITNIISPILALLLTFVSVLFLGCSILDNTKQRKLESVDRLIDRAASELKSILRNQVEMPDAIRDFLNDPCAANTPKWDINKVITQTNTFLSISDSIPNQRIPQSVRMWLSSSSFTHDNFTALSVLQYEYEILIELILRRQRIEVDANYNEVTLKRFEYLFEVLSWVNHFNDDSELISISNKLDQIVYPSENTLRTRIPSPWLVEDFDNEFKKLDGLSCQEILDFTNEESSSNPLSSAA